MGWRVGESALSPRGKVRWSWGRKEIWRLTRWEWVRSETAAGPEPGVDFWRRQRESEVAQGCLGLVILFPFKFPADFNGRMEPGEQSCEQMSG